jgi:uncharacterized protein (DUF486 family)
MTRGIITVGLLVLSNTFMTIAWYGHLRFNQIDGLKRLGLFSIILISWGIAFFEYCAQVPANRLGFLGNGGPFNMFQLKVIQEVISLTVFSVISITLLKGGMLQWNHLVAFLCLILAVFFVFLET